MSRRREELVPGQPSFIVFDSFDSPSLGPTIRIDIQSLVRLNELERLLRNLADGRSQQVQLSEMSDTLWLPPLKGVVLTVAEATPQTKYEKSGDQVTCNWTDSTEGWLESADKTAALAASGKPCHQFFKGWHANSVTITIAFME